MNAADRATYEAVAARAAGVCEACGCWCPAAEGHRDHFFGRKHAPTSVETVWLLCVECDHHKTNSQPSAVFWCRRFQVHAKIHGYEKEAERAGIRLEVLRVKGFAA